MLNNLPANWQHAIVATFDQLPGDVIESVQRELALTPDGMTNSVSDEALKQFAASDIGHTLVTAWRSKAARKVAVIDRLLARIESRLSDEGLQAARYWFASLPPQAKVNLLWYLAG